MFPATERCAAILARAAAVTVLAIGASVGFATQAQAECTYQQPYPDSPMSICIGYGRSCLKSQCSAPPGTPGKWGTDGIYTPCQRRYGCS